jgi:hypothetical protein
MICASGRSHVGVTQPWTVLCTMPVNSTSWGEAKRLHRLTHSEPRVDAFFRLANRKFQNHCLPPSHH